MTSNGTQSDADKLLNAALLTEDSLAYNTIVRALDTEGAKKAD